MLEQMMRVENGFVKPLNIRELQNATVARVYARDKSPDKDFALKELGFVYWVADFKSLPNQSGYDPEKVFSTGIENYGLPPDYKPDDLILSLIGEYRQTYQLGAAGAALSSCLKGLHTCSKLCARLSDELSVKLNAEFIDLEEIENITGLMNSIMKLSKDLPANIKALKEAESNVKYAEEEQKLAYGNKKITKSMQPNNYLQV